ncbi:MAG TPA: transglutaminase domain-containing protein, partial [Spirochaetota bacterium]|nr:transglutaminase domain-containing protein [Spirochaetota bacterium]
MKKIIVAVLTLIIALGALFSIDVKKIKRNIDGRPPLEQIVILERYVKENPESTELYILKAEIEIGERDYLGAKKTLEDVLKIEQNNLKALNLSGMIYYYLNDRENSFKVFKKALKIDKNNEFASYFLSIINPFESANENIVEKQAEDETDVKSLDEGYSDMEKRDFVYLLNRREVEITEEGLYNYTVHCVIKLLSAQGANYFRETSYSFNGYEFYPEVLKAGSYDKNYNFNEINRKNIVIVDKKTTNEVSLFTNRRFVAFPMPDINGESIFEFKIKFHSTGKSLGPKVYDRFLFGGFDGCVNSEYLLKYPKNLKLNILKKGDISEESEDIDQEFVLKRYKYKNPPIYDLKGESVNIFDISPQIIVSAFNDWEEIAMWYSPIFEGIVSKGGGAKEVLASLSLEGKTPLQKVEAIYQYIQKNINYIAVELDESALRPHSPDEIYKNKFGDCKDQATFFIYLLREAGIKAYPLLISTSDNGKAERKVPSPYYFNHMIAHIPSQEGIENEIFCDTTTGVTELYNLPSPDQGVSGYAITENKTGYFKETPVIDYSKNRIEEYYRGDAGIAGDGTLYFTESLKGAYAEMIRYAVAGKSQEEAFDYMFDYQSKTYNNLKKDDLEIEGFERQSGDLKISLKAYDKSLTSIYFDGRHKITFKIKDINSLLNFPANLKYDYVRNFLFSYKKTIEYNFPEGYSVLEGSTKNFERENRYLKFETGANFISDNKFALYFEITFKERAIKNEDMEKILTFLAQIEREISTELIVGKKENFDYAEFYDGLIKIYEQKEVYENYIRKMSEEKNYQRAKEV